MFETYLLLYEALYLLWVVFIISTVQNNILQQGHPFPAFYPLNANRVSWEDRQLTLGILVTEIPLHYNLQPHSLFGCFKGLLKRKTSVWRRVSHSKTWEPAWKVSSVTYCSIETFVKRTVLKYSFWKAAWARRLWWLSQSPAPQARGSH